MASASGAALRLAKPQDAQALPAIEEAAGQMFAGMAGYTAVWQQTSRSVRRDTARSSRSGIVSLRRMDNGLQASSPANPCDTNCISGNYPSTPITSGKDWANGCCGV